MSKTPKSHAVVGTSSGGALGALQSPGNSIEMKGFPLKLFNVCGAELDCCWQEAIKSELPLTMLELFFGSASILEFCRGPARDVGSLSSDLLPRHALDFHLAHENEQVLPGHTNCCEFKCANMCALSESMVYESLCLYGCLANTMIGF